MTQAEQNRREAVYALSKEILASMAGRLDLFGAAHPEDLAAHALKMAVSLDAQFTSYCSLLDGKPEEVTPEEVQVKDWRIVGTSFKEAKAIADRVGIHLGID